MAILEVYIRTGGDDLRGGSWANLVVKLSNQSEPIRFEKFTEGNKLNERTDFNKSVDVPGLNEPQQIEFFQIEHVSQESFGQSRDNWNILRAEITMRFGQFPIIVGRSGYHRFTGSSSILTIPSPPQD